MNANFTCLETKDSPALSNYISLSPLSSARTRMHISPAPHCASAISASAALFRTLQIRFRFCSFIQHGGNSFIWRCCRRRNIIIICALTETTFGLFALESKTNRPPRHGKSLNGTEWREHGAVTDSQGAHPRRLSLSAYRPTDWLTGLYAGSKIHYKRLLLLLLISLQRKREKKHQKNIFLMGFSNLRCWQDGRQLLLFFGHRLTYANNTQMRREEKKLSSKLLF